MVMLSKRCPKCEEVLEASFFSLDKRAKSGLTSYCKRCNSAKTKAWQERNKERYQEGWRNRHLKRKFGISSDDYDRMLSEQGGGCKICGKTEAEERNSFLCVDHCHSTGKVRGLLCDDCNVALGRVKDDVAILRAAITYLEEHHGHT